jgi:hypothetical protein
MPEIDALSFGNMKQMGSLHPIASSWICVAQDPLIAR